jgi:hypothetical protein
MMTEEEEIYYAVSDALAALNKVIFSMHRKEEKELLDIHLKLSDILLAKFEQKTNIRRLRDE